MDKSETEQHFEHLLDEHKWSQRAKAALTSLPPAQDENKCTHEGLVDTGVGYYHCPTCNQGWTYNEWNGTTPAQPDNQDGWVRKKPDFKQECTFITAAKYGRNEEDLIWEYKIWQIKQLDGEDEEGNSAWYWGLLNGEGEEWGDLADLTAYYYKIIEPLPPIKPTL